MLDKTKIEIFLENDDENIIMFLQYNKNNIGKIVLEEIYIDNFIEYNIDNFMDENFFDDYQETDLLKFKELIYDKDYCFLISYFEINPEFRNQGLGSFLFNEMMCYIKKKDNSFLYLNACPMFSKNYLELDDLKKFYLKFGFKTLMTFNNSINMFLDDMNYLKIKEKSLIDEINKKDINNQLISLKNEKNEHSLKININKKNI